jgi:hypothetical protein
MVLNIVERRTKNMLRPLTMNKVIRNIIFPFLVLLFSCDKPGLFTSCKDCLTQEPVDAIIDAKIDPFTETNYYPEINVYEGNIEDGLLRNTYSADRSTVSISVPINKKYTITATYYREGICYIAVDSATPRVKSESDKCDKPCYIVYDNKVDLRIKYKE